VKIKNHNALSPFKLKTINALMESVLNFKLHQRVVSVVFRCYNAFRCAVQGTILDAALEVKSKSTME
jgi:hypothetical protein